MTHRTLKNLLFTMLTASILTTLAAGAAHAQRATITPANVSAAEFDYATFTISANWRYDAEIEFFTENITATAGKDYDGIDNWVYCYEGSDNIGGVSEGCEIGGGETTRDISIFHHVDYIKEGNETYRVVARILRWETGQVDAGGLLEVRECSIASCGRATATGTIIDVFEDPEPEAEGRLSFTTETASVAEGGALNLTIRFTPQPSTTHGPVSVNWQTTDADAQAGIDYTQTSGTVNFSSCSSACGVQTRTIQVRTRQDETRETDESFIVELSDPTNATIELRDLEWVSVTIIDDEENSHPRVHLSAEKYRIEAGERIIIETSANDEEGPILSYKFSGAGNFANYGSERYRKYWTAPRPHSESQDTLTVTVTDAEGATSSASMTITVEGVTQAVPNKPPTVDLTTDHYDVQIGGTVTLTANATDTDGRIASYAWTGDSTFSNTAAREPTWTAPSPTVTTDYVLTVTVTDDDGSTASDSIRVLVNQSPTVRLTADSYTVDRGATTILRTHTTGPDGHIATYDWTGSGTFDTDTTIGTCQRL